MKIKYPVRLRYLIPVGAFLLFVVLAPSVFAIGKPNTVGSPKTVTDRPSNVGNNATGVQSERTVIAV